MYKNDRLIVSNFASNRNPEGPKFETTDSGQD